MKARRILSLSLVPLLLSSCDFSILFFWKSGEDEPAAKNYKDQKVNVYRQPDTIDKQFSLRFYNEFPHVPYVSVDSYFKEFFKTDLALKKVGNSYKYSLNKASYLAFDAKSNLLYANNITAFNSHPDFTSSSGEIFIKLDSVEQTPSQEKVVNLNNYSIALFEDGNNAFVPLTLLSKLSGGLSQYNVAYNGKDVYVMDKAGQLGEATNSTTYGEEYFSILNDTSTSRYRDLANYNYGELCFVFDNLRGYTSQLVFGDNNLLSLGLNGVLEKYAPKVKEYLLSLDKSNYYEGYVALFSGLYDGGHTGVQTTFDALVNAYQRNSEQEFVNLNAEMNKRMVQVRTNVAGSVFSSKLSVLGYGAAANQFYKYDSEAKTAFISFRSFDVDYEGWDNYYKNPTAENIPSDAYGFVRSKLYQALEDEAKNVVLDLSNNGGGNSYALEGIVGLLNGSKSNFNLLDTVSKNKTTEKHLIDINLDGQFDELDVTEANKFKSLNIGVLTTLYSFSCANLLPSILKELGYKIMGEQSGGGSCAISTESTADGLEYVRSSNVCFSDEAGNNIDSGVPVDLEIEHPYYDGSDVLMDYTAFFDLTALGTYLSSAYL